MNKDKILKKSEDFTEIINKGKKIKNQFFSIFYLRNEKTLYGITVPKKYGKAHLRNKIKRQIKNIIITNEKYIQTNLKYVIIIKECSKKIEYQELEKELIELLKKVRI